MDAMPVTSAAEETLDPSDWADVQVLSHRIVDDAVAYLRDVRQRPVWQEMPGDVRDFFTASLPQSPTPLADIYGDVVDKVMPYPMGNIHPRFWAWYMGSSNFTGALGDFLAAIQGSNLGGGNHAAALMDGQVVDWCKQMTGMPASASGTLVSGGSMANIIGLTVARQIAGTAPAGSVILCMLPDTGERYMTTPLFDGIEAEMNAEELALSRSTPGCQFPA